MTSQQPNLTDRDIQIQQHVSTVFLAAGLIGCLLVLLLSIIVADRDGQILQRLQQIGVATQAEVVARHDVGHGYDRLTYRFEISDPAGRPQGVFRTVLVDRHFEPTPPGGRVPIVYDPGRPRNSLLRSELEQQVWVSTTPPSPMLCLAPCLMLLLMGAALHWHTGQVHRPTPGEASKGNL